MIAIIKSIAPSLILVILLGLMLLYYSNKNTEQQGHIRNLEASNAILESNILTNLKVVELLETCK